MADHVTIKTELHDTDRVVGGSDTLNLTIDRTFLTIEVEGGGRLTLERYNGYVVGRAWNEYSKDAEQPWTVFVLAGDAVIRRQHEKEERQAAHD